MNLPNYFLADLPSEARLAGSMITEACRTLKENQERYLSHRSTHEMIEVLVELAGEWLKPDYGFRKLALSAAEQAVGFSASTLARGMDSLFRQLTYRNLEAWLAQDLGNAQRLSDFCATRAEAEMDRVATASGPNFLVHISGGSIPNPPLTQMIMGILLRSAQFVKCASDAAFLPRLFAHSLYQLEPKLGACLEIAAWPGGSLELEEALFAEADCITVTGSDDTLASVRSRLPIRCRFIGYGHRVSFGYITREAMASANASALVARAANDVTAWNQLGCLSPHLFYVERGGRLSGEDFAERLASALAEEENKHPRGPLSVAQAAEIATRRGFYQVRAAHDPQTKIWESPGSTAWTVVYEENPQFAASCLHRFIHVRSVTDLDEALRGADSVRGRVSTVGLEASQEEVKEMAAALAKWGVTRICPVGKMQDPSLLWRHDGRPALGDLVIWSDWEKTPLE